MAGTPSYTVNVEGSGAFPCRGDQKVLIAMERAGQARLPVGCRGGGCGACKVLVLSGQYHTAKMSAAHVTREEETRGYALACRLFPEGDLSLRPAGTVFRTA